MTVFFRDRNSGNIVDARAARRRSRKAGYIHVPKDLGKWSAKLLDKCGVDPVAGSPKPDVDLAYKVLTGKCAEKVKGRWVQKWIVTDRYNDVDSLRGALLKEVDAIADEVRVAGVTVDGVRVATSPEGITNIITAKASGKGNRKFVADRSTVYTLTKKQVDEMHDKAVGHVQACYERQAELIAEIQSSDDPASVDIQSGWPE